MGSVVKSDFLRRSTRIKNIPLKQQEQTTEQFGKKVPAGNEYQTKMIEFTFPFEHCPEQQDQAGAMLMWSPNHNIPAKKLDNYIKISKEKHGLNEEQSLALLLRHKYDVKKAIQDQRISGRNPEYWTEKEKECLNKFISSRCRHFSKIVKKNKELSRQTVTSCMRMWYKMKTEEMELDGRRTKYKIVKNGQQGKTKTKKQ